MLEYMLSDLQYSDDLRTQRDDWAAVMRCLERSGIKNNRDIDNAKERIESILKRINEPFLD